MAMCLVGVLKMKDHILLQLAVRFPGGDPPINQGRRYDRFVGIWVAEGSDVHLMANPTGPRKPPPQPRPGPMSKKGDIETGEDMKGG
jgi:hypothetical protein